MDEKIIRESTSIKIDPAVWREGKKRAIDKNLTIGEYVEELIKADLKKK